MTDFAKGAYRRPWEDDIKVSDGRAFGFEPLPH